MMFDEYFFMDGSQASNHASLMFDLSGAALSSLPSL